MLINGIRSYVDANNKFWFLLKDVCEKFDIANNYNKMLKSVSDWQKSVLVNSNEFTDKEVFINESALYQVAMFGADDIKSDRLQEEIYENITSIRKDLYQKHPSLNKYFGYTNLEDRKYDDASHSNQAICKDIIAEKLDRVLDLLEHNVHMKALEKQVDSLTVMLDKTAKENDRIKRKFRDYRDSIVNRGKNKSEFESEKKSDYCCTKENPLTNVTDPTEEFDENESCTCQDTESKKVNKKSDEVEQVASLFGNLIKSCATDIEAINNLLKSEK